MGWLLGLAALWFLGLPLLFWVILGDEAAPQLEPFDPARHPDSPEITAFLRDNIATLAAEEFRQVADLVRETPRTTSRVVLLQHPHGETGMIAVVYTPQGLASSFVEFSAEVSGGRTFDVSNVASVQVFAPRRGHDNYRFPEVRDPARLYRIFQALLRRRFGSATLQQPDIANDPARWLARAMDKEHDGQVEAGYFRFDERARKYRPTLKGAYLMTWKMMQPFKAIRMAGLRRRARELLRQIGMEAEDQRPVAAPEGVTVTEPRPTVEEAPPRGFDWLALALWGAMAVLLVATVLVQRFTGSAFAGSVVLLGGCVTVLWLTLRRRGQGRAVLPLAALAVVALAMMGFREYQATQPIDRSELSVPGDFPGAVRALESLTRSKARPLVARDAAGTPDTTAAFYIRSRPARTRELMDSTIRREFQQQGFFLFVWQRNYRRGSDVVALYPSPDKYVVLRAFHTGTPKVTSNRLVAWFRELEGEYPLRLSIIRRAGVEGRMLVGLDSAQALEVARRFSEFCPDLERRGLVTTQQRAEYLRESGYFQCWWERDTTTSH